MRIRQIRNATIFLEFGGTRLLVDPMLAAPGAFPGFKMFGGGRQRNPLIKLPEDAMQTLESATAVLVTHEHPDHLDQPALDWIKEHSLPVLASDMDQANLRRKGLQVHGVDDSLWEFDGEVIPGRHGRGLLGWLMGPVAGFYLRCDGEPSIYLTGDTILTAEVVEAIELLRPDIVVAPGGAANFGIGKDIIFSLEEQVQLARLAPGMLVINHLESLDHCPTTRRELRARMNDEGLQDKVLIPDDGEWLEFAPPTSAPTQPRPRPAARPGFQKWLTAKFAGTK